MDQIGSALAAATTQSVSVDASSGGLDQLSSGAAEASSSVKGLTSEVGALTVAQKGAQIGAGALEGSTSQLAGTLSGVGGSMVPVVAGFVALGAGADKLFHSALDLNEAQERWNKVLGDSASVVDHIDVGGLNISIKDLGEQFGSTEAQIKTSATNIYQVGINSGNAAPQVANTTKEIVALAAQAVSLNPKLGSLSTVTDGLSRGLVRGGRFLSQYGLAALSLKDITDLATISTGKAANELTTFDKQTAAATLEMQRMGASMKGDVTEGAKSATLTFQSLKTQVQQSLAELGKPLIPLFIADMKNLVPILGAIGKGFELVGQAVLPILGIGLKIADIVVQSKLLVPALAGIATGFAAVKAVGLANTLISAVAGFGGLTGAIKAAGVAMAGFVTEEALATAALSLIAAGITYAFMHMNDATKEQKQILSELSKAYKDVNADTNAATNSVIAETVARDHLDASLTKSGVSMDTFKAAILGSKDAQDQMSDAFNRGTQAQNAQAIGMGYQDLSLARLKESYNTLKSSVEKSAKAEFDSAVANGDLSQAQLSAAITAGTAANGQFSYASALQAVHAQIIANQIAQDQASASSSGAVEASLGVEQAKFQQAQAQAELTAANDKSTKSSIANSQAANNEIVAAHDVVKAKEAVAKAEQGVATAQDAVTSSTKAITKAQTDLTLKTKDVADAQDHYNKVLHGFGAASQEAVDASDKLTGAYIGNERAQLSQEQAVIKLEQAQLSYNNTLDINGNTTDASQQASFNLRQAHIDLETANYDLGHSTKDLSSAQKDYNDTLNGADPASKKAQDALVLLQTAQGNQQSAIDALAQANKDLVSKQQAVIDSQTALGDSHFALQQAIFKSQQKTDGLGASAKAATILVDGMTVAMFNQAQQAKNTGDALGKMADNAVEASGRQLTTTQALIDKNAGEYDAIQLQINQLAPGNPLRSYLQGFQTELSSTPGVKEELKIRYGIDLDPTTMNQQVQQVAQTFGQLTVGSVFSGLISGVIKANSPNITIPKKSGASGGVIPGAQGEPTPILAHGGELLLNKGQQQQYGIGQNGITVHQGAVQVNLNGPINQGTIPQVQQAVDTALQKLYVQIQSN